MNARKRPLASQLHDSEAVVEWPCSVVSKVEDENDLGTPLSQLLTDLAIKGKPEDEQKTDGVTAAFSGTPVSVSIIESGLTAGSKWWATSLAALGGGTAVWARVSDFWMGKAVGVQTAMMFSVAIVIAACILGIAAIMYGDVRARGQGAAAQYHARAEVAVAFLAGATAMNKAAATPVKVQQEPCYTALAVAVNGEPDGDAKAALDLLTGPIPR